MPETNPLFDALAHASAEANNALSRKRNLHDLRKQAEDAGGVIPARDCTLRLSIGILDVIDAEIAACDRELDAIADRLRKAVIDGPTNEPLRGSADEEMG